MLRGRKYHRDMGNVHNVDYIRQQMDDEHPMLFHRSDL